MSISDIYEKFKQGLISPPELKEALAAEASALPPGYPLAYTVPSKGQGPTGTSMTMTTTVGPDTICTRAVGPGSSLRDRGYARTPGEASLDPLDLLKGRLRITGGPFKGIEHVHIYAARDKVFVFYLKDGVPNVLEDEAAMFPSDTLIGQFRLIMG
jgi:hypothetical protein